MRRAGEKRKETPSAGAKNETEPGLKNIKEPRNTWPSPQTVSCWGSISPTIEKKELATLTGRP